MEENIKKRLRLLRKQYGIPTAKKGVPLFQPGKLEIDESYVANVYPCNDIRALGFKSAADNLVDISGNKPGYADHFVYSIIYLYRMYIEIRLKTIIEIETQKWRKGHKLKELWKEAKPMMISSSQFFDDQELKAVEEKINEFCRIDPFSDAGRYANDKNEAPTLSGIQTLDLKHFKHVMDSISTSLEGAYTAISERSAL